MSEAERSNAPPELERCGREAAEAKTWKCQTVGMRVMRLGLEFSSSLEARGSKENG